jgi:hypothetical protein
MLIRLTFCLITQFLVCTSLFTQSATPAATTAERTFWDHNGSVMYLVANGSSRELYYQKPRAGMLEVGVRSDSLLFRGEIKDEQFSGTAYIFNAQCGQVPFEVKGSILDNGARIVLTGQAPRVGRNCLASGHYISTLEFKLLRSTEVAQPLQPSTTAPVEVEQRRPEVLSTDVGEAKSGAASAAPPMTAQAPVIDAPKPEVHSSELGGQKQASDAPVQPSERPNFHPAAQDLRSLAPVIMAMNALFPFLSIGLLIWLLKSAP